MEIGDEMLLGRVATGMITTQEVITSLVFTTRWTIGTIARVPTMDHVTNGEDSMRPLDEEVGTFAGFTITHFSVKIPINVTCEGPFA